MLLCSGAPAAAEYGPDGSPDDGGSCMSRSGFEGDRPLLRGHNNVRNFSIIGDEAGMFGRSAVVVHRCREGEYLPGLMDSR